MYQDQARWWKQQDTTDPTAPLPPPPPKAPQATHHTAWEMKVCIARDQIGKVKQINPEWCRSAMHYKNC